MPPALSAFRAVDLTTLVLAEYHEMPGLRLTLDQAARLWNADVNACRSTLDVLVQEGFLRRAGEMYVRADCGTWED